jgi:hypothetical protein
VIAALSAWHEDHEVAAKAIEDVKRLPAHVVIEAYSVLTRLPGGRAVPAATAANTLVDRFPEPPLRLNDDDRTSVLTQLSTAAILGGASYDGLVALEAKAHERALLSLDRRAVSTYQRLGAAYTLIA